MKSLCIVIPAYNEENKLSVDEYRAFIQTYENVSVLFVNDCSTDQTEPILQTIQKGFENRVFILSNAKNVGKAQSVQIGMKYAFEHIVKDNYAFLDADLATSLEDCLLISQCLQGEVICCFGSRILRVDSRIERKAYRHYIGRVVATAISKTLKLEIYDTQCGCKAFEQKVAKIVFDKAFISKWLFDVEVFFRIIQLVGRKEIKNVLYEYPLKQWIDKGESKVKFSYFFKLWLDLWQIKQTYKRV